MRLTTFLLGIAYFYAPFTIAFAQGSLTPPGAPTPTMKALDEVEARYPISHLPTNITVSGSYYLTTNAVGVSGANGITVAASDVTIDLNGFTLQGVAGATAGIGYSGVVRNVHVRNGTIRGWPNSGISLGAVTDAVVDHMLVISNGTTGISLTDRARVEACTVTGNTIDGLNVGRDARVLNCVATGNGSSGIRAADGSIVTACVANGNAKGGINAQNHSIVRECTATGNTNAGITVNSITKVIDCVARANAGHGIVTALRSVVEDCVATLNATNGISITGDCRIIGNHCSANGTSGVGAGISVSSSGNLIENNYCAGNVFGFDVPVAASLIIRNVASGNSGTGTPSADYNLHASNVRGTIVTAGGLNVSTNGPVINISY